MLNSLRIKIFAFIFSLMANINLMADGNARVNLPIEDTSVAGLLKTILGAILSLSVPLIVLSIVYVGFLFVKSQGNDSELSKAKEALVYVLIGTAAIIAFNALFNIFFAAYSK